MPGRDGLHVWKFIPGRDGLYVWLFVYFRPLYQGFWKTLDLQSRFNKCAILPIVEQPMALIPSISFELFVQGLNFFQ